VVARGHQLGDLSVSGFPPRQLWYIPSYEGVMNMTNKSALIVPLVLAGCLLVTSSSAPAQSAAPLEQGEHNTVELLRLMDRDQDGDVSRAEFDTFMNKQFDRLDVNHDGRLDENELAKLQWRNYLSTQLLPLMDTDRSGYVSRQEFMSFMDQEFDRLDVSHRGHLNVEELAEKQAPHITGK
jgi:hypothetical protein